MLVQYYLTTLRSEGVDLDDSVILSQLFYADDEHADELAAKVASLSPQTEDKTETSDEAEDTAETEQNIEAPPN